MKVCTGCATAKRTDHFPKRSASKDGLGHRCKPCASEYHKNYYRKNREAVLARSKDYYRSNTEKMRSTRRSWRLRSKYGITEADYDEMSARQGGLCAICGDPPEGRRLVVDHSHATGAVRGLLCDACNMGIGLLRECSFILESAAVYLEGISQEGGGAQCQPAKTTASC